VIGLSLIAYFVVGLGIFSILVKLGRVPLDADIARRVDSPLLGRFLRRYLIWILSPWERALVRVGITPNGITFISLLTSLGAAIALAMGRFTLGGWLYHLTGILDVLDGRVARATGQVSRGGAYFDSVIDRYAELIVFGGLACFYRSSWLMLLVLAAALGSIMVSYTRARGEALGVDVKVGTMQRPERVFYLGLALVMAPLLRDSGALVLGMRIVPAVLGWLAISANWTAIARIRHTMEKLRTPVTVTPPAVVLPLRRWN
jgi:phosphatidylglycerophosphate synthase